MKNARGFRRTHVRSSGDVWSWIAGAVIIALLLVNAIGLANKITGRNLMSVAGVAFPTSGLDDNVPPTRTR